MPEHETIALEQDLAWREKAMWLLIRRLGRGEVTVTDEEWASVPPLPELVISREGDSMVWTAKDRNDEKGPEQ